MLPSLFISHGSPMTVLRDVPARRFMQELGATLPRPKAIIAASAHWETAEPTLSLAEHPRTIHDFRGFPAELFAMQYPAPGAPDLAREAAGLLEAAGLHAELNANRGLDHGAWTPLILGWPEHDIPVVSLSVQPHQSAAHHLAVGHALRALRAQDVLIMASGSLTHNLYEIDPRDDAPTSPWARDFAETVKNVLATNPARLAEAETLPGFRQNHPTPEHFLPLPLAAGAGDTPTLIHESFDYGALSMAAWRFD